jgi:DNA-directed RNA polymerase specialized sigma subunit
MSTEYLNNKTFERLIVKFQSSKREKLKYQLLVEDIKQTEIRTIKREKYKKPEPWFNVEKKYTILNLNYQDVQKELAIAFYTLSENIVRYAKFNLIDQDDAIQEGVMICFEKIDRFDPQKGKAFNYMTTCILNHFRQMYRTARNYNELKKKYLNFVQMQFDKQLSINSNKKGIYKKHNISSDA